MLGVLFDFLKVCLSPLHWLSF